MTVDNKRGAQQSTNSTAVDADKQAQMNAVWQRIEQKSAAGNDAKKHRNLAFKIILPIFVLENIGLVILLILLLVGVVSLNTKAPEAKTVAVYNVCGDLVDQYNELQAGTYEYGDDSYSDGVANLAGTIQGREHANDDATCQYLLIQASIQALNGSEAQKALDRYSELVDKGVNPSPDITNFRSSDILEQTVNAINGDYDTPEEDSDGMG